MIEHIKKQVKEIKDRKMYNPVDIHEMGVIVNTKSEPSQRTLYRLIESGKIPATNIGTGERPRFMVSGSDLKKYLKSVYKL